MPQRVYDGIDGWLLCRAAERLWNWAVQLAGGEAERRLRQMKNQDLEGRSELGQVPRLGALNEDRAWILLQRGAMARLELCFEALQSQEKDVRIVERTAFERWLSTARLPTLDPGASGARVRHGLS